MPPLPFEISPQECANFLATRMHSSRMRTVRSSSCLPGWCLPQCMLGYFCRGGGVRACLDTPSLVNRMTDRCKKHYLMVINTVTLVTSEVFHTSNQKLKLGNALPAQQHTATFTTIFHLPSSVFFC